MCHVILFHSMMWWVLCLMTAGNVHHRRCQKEIVLWNVSSKALNSVFTDRVLRSPSFNENPQEGENILPYYYQIHNSWMNTFNITLHFFCFHILIWSCAEYFLLHIVQHWVMYWYSYITCIKHLIHVKFNSHSDHWW